MRQATPKVFLIGESRIIEDGLREYLRHIGVPEWESDALSDPELLVEVMGRLCYRSFRPGMNPNVKKIREHNKEYLNNILTVKHGSVLEHAMLNFVFTDVSRVFTHELVRHRPGTAISQESLRFVLLQEFGQWVPSVIREDPKAVEIFASTFEQLEELQKSLADHFQLDDPRMDFSQKKKITSAIRRVAPMGLATTIGWSANPRTIRWVIELRTHPSAEEEIRYVFGQVGEILMKRYPHLFGDFEISDVDGLPHFKPSHSKV